MASEFSNLLARWPTKSLWILENLALSHRQDNNTTSFGKLVKGHLLEWNKKPMLVPLRRFNPATLVPKANTPRTKLNAVPIKWKITTINISEYWLILTPPSVLLVCCVYTMICPISLTHIMGMDKVQCGSHGGRSVRTYRPFPTVCCIIKPFWKSISSS